MSQQALRKILYAEDEPDIAEIARISLEMIGGFEVDICTSGAEVVASARRFGPDLVLLDVMMPGVDGPSALHALRAESDLEHIPVVFMTAKVMKEEMERFREIGALGVIAKPFDPETLPEQIAALWSKHAQQ